MFHRINLEAWFIGFIPQYTSSVWIGFAEEQLPLTDVEINGEVIRNVSGGRVPAPMWKEFMTKVVENLPVLECTAEPKVDNLRISKTNEVKPEIKKVRKQETEKREYKIKESPAFSIKSTVNWMLPLT